MPGSVARETPCIFTSCKCSWSTILLVRSLCDCPLHFKSWTILRKTLKMRVLYMLIFYVQHNTHTHTHIHTIRCLRIVATDIKSIIILRIKVKLNLSFCTRRRHIGGVGVQFYSSLNSAPDGGEWSTSRSDRFTPRENPGTNLIGGWVGPRAGLDVGRRGKSLASTGIRTPDCPDRTLIHCID
jgi:hypothetical protein